jgi:hypothetical protein
MKNKAIAIALSAGSVLYIGLYVAYAMLAWRWKAGDHGSHFGDTFGAFNALFSGFGLIGLAIAIFLQYRQLQTQSEELRLQREELTLTREQLGRSAQAQEQSEQALRKQLLVMTLSTPITATVQALEKVERHMEYQHGNRNIDGWGLQQLKNHLESVKNNQSWADRDCLLNDLPQLIDLRTNLQDIKEELSRL